MLIMKVDQFNRRTDIRVYNSQGDVFMLETIIENLIENAVKYSGTNPCITLYSFQNEKEIVFGVKDQGPGIPLTERENIFTKFFF